MENGICQMCGDECDIELMLQCEVCELEGCPDCVMEDEGQLLCDYCYEDTHQVDSLSDV